MSIQTKMPTTADEFLRWNEGREGKREFVRGRVVELMINVTRNHIEIAGNLFQTLRQQPDRKQFTVGSADFAVRTADGIRYPDVFVDRKGATSKGGDLAATEPLLLAEVLSPSSYGRDFVEKLADYRTMDPVLYYLILAHEEPRVWLCSRVSNEWGKPVEIAGLEAFMSLEKLSVTIALADIYEGVDIRSIS